MKIQFTFFTLFLSLLSFSQAKDSLSGTTQNTQKKLANESATFFNDKSQEARTNIYLKAINENAAASQKMEVTKGQIDAQIVQESAKEASQLNLNQLKMMSIIVSPNEIGAIPLSSVLSSSEAAALSTLGIIISPQESNLPNIIDNLRSNKIPQESILPDIIDNLQKNKKRLVGPSDYDSRIELLQLNPNISWQLAMFKKSESVAMIVEKEKVNQVSAEIYTLDISCILGKMYNLCPNEYFYNQPVVGTGTAFITGDTKMFTANHVFERPITDYVVVFGFQIVQANGVVENFFDKKNLYYPKKVINKSEELDVIEFEVDRIFDRPVLEWENSSKVFESGTNEIYMLGHPSGLPMKVALNASIDNDSHPLYYFTSLDSFQGNSGSPVFNFYTNRVIGVLVAGELDYEFNGNCYYSKIHYLPYCPGEKVIRIEEIMKQFKQ